MIDLSTLKLDNLTVTEIKHKMTHTFEQSTNDPQTYYWFKEGFTKTELERIYREVDQLPLEKAKTFSDNDKSVRSSSVKWIPKTAQWDWLYQKLMKYAVEANDTLWHFDLISAPELIQYTEYYASEGGHYDWHQDIGPGFGSLRKVSITVQLSETDEYEGGDLELWQGGQSILSSPRGAGNVVIFPSYMMHRVKRVEKGTRRSFVLWVGGQHYK
jgi:PKHD-type hydroxylase